MNAIAQPTAPPIIFVVPCYNEAERLDCDHFTNFAKSHPDIGLWFVNDGSSDGTLDCLHTIRQHAPFNTAIIDLTENCGKAEAVRRGLVQALDTGPFAVGFLDADLATPLEEIPRFQEVLQRHPQIRMVIGSRIPLLGHHIQRRKKRSLCGRAFAFAASATLQQSIFDTQCGAKLFRNDVEIAKSLSRPFDSRWIFDVEILARLHQFYRFTNVAQLDEVIYELPLENWREVDGSKLKSGDFVKAAYELLTIFRSYILVRRPWFWNEVMEIGAIRLPAASSSVASSSAAPVVATSNDQKAA